MTAFEIQDIIDHLTTMNFQLGCCKYNPEHPKFAEIMKAEERLGGRRQAWQWRNWSIEHTVIYISALLTRLGSVDSEILVEWHVNFISFWCLHSFFDGWSTQCGLERIRAQHVQRTLRLSPREKRKGKRVGEKETKDSMEAACLEKCQNFMIFYSESFHFHIHLLTPDPQAKIQALW